MIVKFKSDSKTAEMLFSDGSKISVWYRHMKDDVFNFAYDLGCVNGVMKVKEKWMSEFNDVMGQAECAMPELFLPTILNYLGEIEQGRLEHILHIIELYDKKDWESLSKISWIHYGNMRTNNKIIKEVRQHNKLYVRTTKQILKMQNCLNTV